jgi:predicted ester cyclase
MRRADIQQHKTAAERFDQLVRCGDPADLDELALRTWSTTHLPTADQWVSRARASSCFSVGPIRDEPNGCGLVHRDQQIVAEKDLVVQFVVMEAVWPGGLFRGVNTQSGPYTTDAAFMYRFVDGRIAERWAVRDDLGTMRKLGAMR